jgi:plastocyanin
MRIPLIAAAAVTLVAAAPTAADNGQLVGSVGPGYSISLKDSTGAAVTHLAPGTYTLLVHDQGDIHNFHLTGPGVDVATDIVAVGDSTFTITLTDGTYSYQCDAHGAQMHGSFTVGAVSGPTPPPAPKPAKPKTSALAVGPGKRLVAPAHLTAGRYAFTVRDSSKVDNVHLQGTGVNRKTGVAFTGVQHWTVTLKKGTYRVWSDAHPTLKRSIAVK